MSDMHSNDASRLAPGTRLNGIFEIGEFIASGGMGEVYRGHVVETGDAVAIKVMRTDLANNETGLALFRKEASALHLLHHEAIVRYYVFSSDPDIRRHYLAMEFVDGEPLSELLKRGPLCLDDVRILQTRLASALHAAHQHGIIHRDVSPDNVIIPGGDVTRTKIIDFGIARSTRPGDRTVIGSGFAGKYNYVSPEQVGLFGGKVTAKSDIYSLGIVLAQCLTGQRLDLGGSEFAVVEKRRVVPDLSAVDEHYRALLTSMLQPDPKDRPASMAEVAAWQPGSAGPAGTAAAATSSSGKAVPPGGMPQAGGAPATQLRTTLRRRSRSGEKMELTALVLVALLSCAGVAWYLLEPASDPTAPGIAEREAERQQIEREAALKREAEERTQRQAANAAAAAPVGEAEQRAAREAALEREARQARREAEERAEEQRKADARAQQDAAAAAAAAAEEEARKEATAKAAAEEQARQEATAKAAAEARARQEAAAAVEAQRQRLEREALQREAEERAQREAEERARQEASARTAAEEQARKETAAKAEAEEQARHEAAAKAAAEEQARQQAAAKAVAEEQARQQVAAKAAAEEQAREEAAAKVAAEQQARQAAAAAEAERRRLERETALKLEAEEQTRKEATAKAAAEEQARREAAAKAATEERARQEAAEAERRRLEREAAERARQEAAAKVAAEEQARQEAAAKAAAEEQARQEAAAKTTAEARAAIERQIRITRFVNNYDGGDCFFVTPILVEANHTDLDGYGNSPEPFNVLDSEFKRANGFEANIGLHQVTLAQCAAVTFLSRTRNQPGLAPNLEITATAAKSGSSLTGSISDLGDRHVELLLVDERGMVQNLSDRLTLTGATRSFTIYVPRNDAGAGQPRLLLALATRAALQSLDQSRLGDADDVFARILKEARDTGQSLNVSARYFKLEN